MMGELLAIIFLPFIGGAFVGFALALLWAAFEAFGLPHINFYQGLAVMYSCGFVGTFTTIGVLAWQDYKMCRRK